MAKPSPKAQLGNSWPPAVTPLVSLISSVQKPPPGAEPRIAASCRGGSGCGGDLGVRSGAWGLPAPSRRPPAPLMSVGHTKVPLVVTGEAVGALWPWRCPLPTPNLECRGAVRGIPASHRLRVRLQPSRGTARRKGCNRDVRSRIPLASSTSYLASLPSLPVGHRVPLLPSQSHRGAVPTFCPAAGPGMLGVPQGCGCHRHPLFFFFSCRKMSQEACGGAMLALLTFSLGLAAGE